MSNYTKATNFATKDTLLKGDPLKVVNGTEIDDEFNAIQTAVNSKANTNSPTFTGIPAAPTAAANTNTTQLATTAFVNAERTNAATLTNKTLTSPTLTGTPVAPTAVANTNTTQVATTAHVYAERTNVATLTNKTIVSPSLSGTPTAPTAVAGTNTTQIATTAFVSTALTNYQSVVNAALQAIYPIGSIYTNATNGTNPATLLGFGTWVRFGEGRVLVSQDSSNSLFNTAEETGGSYDAINVAHTHTGTTSTIGDHTHLSPVRGGTEGSTHKYPTEGKYTTNTDEPTSAAGAHNHTFTTASSGESGTNKNIQPYITVYMWKRTA